MAQLDAISGTRYHRESPLLQTLAPQAVSTVGVIENLDIVTGSIDENKKMPAEWILLYHMTGHRDQSVEGLTHIGHLGTQVDLSVSRRHQHD